MQLAVWSAPHTMTIRLWWSTRLLVAGRFPLKLCALDARHSPAI
ncbi:MAG: hypothetical protein OXH15_11540 [Gammaproteobacteria bacterium]|nr:hypothetical protein [Gammaproteobacteria bacterium]